MADDVIGLVLSEVLGSRGMWPVPQAVAEVEGTLHRRPWLTRSTVMVGGAASLAVGALLGGILEGVPVLLPPPVAASGSAPIVKSNLAVAAQTVARTVPLVASHQGTGSPAAGGATTPAAPVLQAAGNAPAGSGSTTPSLPVPTVLGGSGGGATPVSSVQLPVAAPVQGNGQGTGSGAGGGGTTAPCSLCSVLSPVTGTLQQAAGALPVVGGTVSSTLGSTLQTVSGALGSATGSAGTSAGSTSPVGGLVAPVSGALGSVGSAVSSVPVVGGTVSGVLGGL